jgi:hypothetical protein
MKTIPFIDFRQEWKALQNLAPLSLENTILLYLKDV